MVEAVRWGFVGAGNIARNALAPAVHAAAGATLYAAGAREVSRAAALEPSGAAYEGYQAVLDDERVEAVYISLANDAHVPWALRAVAAGKAVLCEKPLGLTAAEVDELRVAAEESGVLVAEASWYRWHPRIRAAQQVISSGALGEPSHVESVFDAALSVPETNYRLDPALGGGALYDLGCYAISAALWATGGQPPTEVAVRRTVGPTAVDLATDAVLRWGSGTGSRTADIRCGMARTPAQRLVVRCERGQVEVPNGPFMSRNVPAELWVERDGHRETRSYPPVDPYQLMVEEFSSVLRGGPGWVLPLAESRACAATIDAVMAAEALP